VLAFGARDKRSVGRSDDPLLTKHVADLNEAERLVNALHSAWSDEASGLEPEDETRVRQAMDRLNERWHGTAVGATLRLYWPG
jgi:hypothetical protein